MKNTLFYYYNINVTNIRQVNKYFAFELDKVKYRLIVADRTVPELNSIYELNLNLIKKGILVHEIILNSNNQIITYINQIPYVLLKIKIKDDEELILADIIHFQLNTKGIDNYDPIKRNNWYDLWTSKIDYFEYQVSQLSKKYPIVRESFSYFVGLAEMSISLLKINSKNKQNSLSVSHKRIKSDDKLFDLYNPINFIIDSTVRDASEYFKSLFLNRTDIINEIIYYLTYSKLSTQELEMFFVRMIFPTFYFDVYENVIEGNTKEKELLNIIAHVNDYELLLKQIYTYLRQVIYLPEIEMFRINQPSY